MTTTIPIRDAMVKRSQEIYHSLNDTFDIKKVQQETKTLCQEGKTIISEHINDRLFHEGTFPVLFHLHKARTLEAIQTETDIKRTLIKVEKLFAELTWYGLWSQGNRPTEANTRNTMIKSAQEQLKMIPKDFYKTRYELRCIEQSMKLLQPEDGIWKQFIGDAGSAISAATSLKLGPMLKALKSIAEKSQKEWANSRYDRGAHYESSMRSISESATSLTLLGRLRDHPDDPSSWQQFVARYGLVIESWLRRWGLQEADALDVKQNVLMALSKQMRSFEYNPSGRFRSWLQTVAYRAWVDFLRSNRHRLELIGETELLDSLSSDEAQASFLETLHDECTRELFELAIERVRPRVKPSTWEAFRLLTWEQLSADQVADKLGLTKGAVFVARGRVKKMLTAAIEEIESDASSKK